MGTTTPHYGWYIPADGEGVGGTPDNDWADEMAATINGIDARFFSHAVPGLEHASAYTDVAETLIVDAESATGWHALQVDSALSAPGPATDSNHTQGSTSVEAYLKWLSGDTTACLYVNLTEAGYPSGLTVKPGQVIFVDIFANDFVSIANTVTGFPNNIYSAWSITIASGPDFTGTVLQKVYTFAEALLMDTTRFLTVPISVGALTNIRSIGLKKTATGGPGGGLGRVRWHLDNIRLSAQTPLDQAYYSQTNVAAVQVPGYSTAVTQYPLSGAATKSTLDLRKGYVGANNVRYMREFALDETGATDISTQLTAVIASLNVGDTLMGAPGALYRTEQPIYIQKPGVTLDGGHSTFFRTTNPYAASDFEMFGVKAPDVSLRKMKLVGFRASTSLGSNNVLYAGTPVISGTTYTLSTLNDEVQAPLAYSDATHKVPFAFGRDQLGRQRFEWMLSDNNHVAGDCKINIRDEDGTILQTTTLTLTGTPTLYTVYYTPKDVFKRVTPTVQKATATANTIILTSMTAYSRAAYVTATEFDDGIRIYPADVGGTWAAADRCLVEDVWIEGCGGPGIITATDTMARAAKSVRIRRIVTLCCGMDGVDFNAGKDHTAEDIVTIFSGRHGFDLEPEGTTHSLRHLSMRNITYWKPLLQALNFGGAAKVHDVTIDGVFIYMDAPIGYMSGSVGETVTIRNARMLRTDNPSDASIANLGANTFLSGIDMTLENWEIDGQINLLAGTVVDENSVSRTCSGALLRNIKFRRPCAQGYLNITMPGVHLDGIYQVASDDASGINPALPVVSPIGLAADTTYRNVNLTALRTALPNTFKGIADGQPWFPGGLDLNADPLYGVQGLSAGAIPARNLDGVAAAVLGGATSASVVFGSPPYPDPTSFALAGTTGGTLATSTTYYYRVAARTLAGPRLPLSEQSLATVANTAATITINGLYSLTLGAQIVAWTIYRGTSPGVYDTRYDIVPDRGFPGAQNTALNQVKFTDLGTTLIGTVGAIQNLYGYTFPVAMQTGSFTPADESGWEADTAYGAFLSPNYLTTAYVSAKRRNGFDVALGTAGPGTQPVISFITAANVADGVSRSAYTTPSFTPPANSRLLIVTGSTFVPNPVSPAITDTAGLSWTQKGPQKAVGANNGISCFTANVGGSPSAMTITATFGATQVSALISVYAVTHCGAILQFAHNNGATGLPLVSLLEAPKASSITLAFTGSQSAKAATGGFTRDKDSATAGLTVDCFSLNGPAQNFTVTGTANVWGAFLAEIAADSSVTGSFDWLLAR